ncbi:anti-sigma factor [soil metagenome]
MDTYTPQRTVTDDELHSLLDGRLDAAARDTLQARVDADPQAASTLAAWRSQQLALRALHSQVLDEPVPPALSQAAIQTAAALQQVSQWWRWGGMAAGLVLAFGVGWLSRGQMPSGAGASATIAGTQPAREFARQASVAHAVFSPEVRHPVEVAAAQQEHLVQWLSKRLGRPLKVPSLTAHGYDLVGGRLLPGDAGARAQFMFQNSSGERVTLYVGAVNAKAGDAAAKETAFSFSADGPVPGFYWVDQGFGYALAGKMSREALVKLADAVYKQLEPGS